MKLAQTYEKRLRILTAILTLGIVVSVPLLVAPINFISGGDNPMGFYFAAVLAPLLLLLLYLLLFCGKLWKFSAVSRPSPLTQNATNSQS